MNVQNVCYCAVSMYFMCYESLSISMHACVIVSVCMCVYVFISRLVRANAQAYGMRYYCFIKLDDIALILSCATKYLTAWLSLAKQITLNLSSILVV